jgi:hypothetical protein
MDDDTPDRFLLYECRVPAAFWGKEWAALEAGKPDGQLDFITRMLKFVKATKKQDAYYRCLTRGGERVVIGLADLVEFKAQGLFDGKKRYCSCIHTQKKYMLKHKIRRYRPSKLLQQQCASRDLR